MPVLRLSAQPEPALEVAALDAVSGRKAGAGTKSRPERVAVEPVSLFLVQNRIADQPHTNANPLAPDEAFENHPVGYRLLAERE